MIDECIICLEELEKNIVTLSCGHKYHLKCIREWSNIKKKNQIDYAQFVMWIMK